MKKNMANISEEIFGKFVKKKILKFFRGNFSGASLGNFVKNSDKYFEKIYTLESVDVTWSISGWVDWSPHGGREEKTTNDKSMADCILPVL